MILNANSLRFELYSGLKNLSKMLNDMHTYTAAELNVCGPFNSVPAENMPTTTPGRQRHRPN